ncbi:hypothetical protein QJQ45_016643 [Haematococcus lacustris]|nr:hypothetical protein QJQ45_016643 [Haematococcus lacustris]
MLLKHRTTQVAGRGLQSSVCPQRLLAARNRCCAASRSEVQVNHPQPSTIGYLAAAALSAALSIASPALAYDSGMLPDTYVESREEARFDENLMTPELKALLSLLDQKGSTVKTEELEQPRLKVGFKRYVNGRVALRSRDNQWFELRADMQVDLSDDAVVAMLFASGAWYDVIEPMEMVQNGARVPLRMTRFDFHNAGSLLEDMVDVPMPDGGEGDRE